MFSRKNVPKKPTRIVNEQNLMRKEAADMDLDSLKSLEMIIETFTEHPEINLTEMRSLLAKCGFKVKDSELEKLLPLRTTRFDYSVFLTVVKEVAKNCDSAEEYNEILNAFVALGGNSDKTGSVQKTVLVNIVRKQFELTFNIEEFLDVATEGNELDFSTFSNIFVQAMEHGSQKNIESRSSIRSISVGLPSIKIGEEGATERIQYSDFEQWLLHNYN